jgi:enoyl-CoA hydratase
MAKVLYEKRNRIGYITLNRPDALNALDDELNCELWTVWDDFARDESLDVSILTGAGRAFCPGADLKTFIPKWEKGEYARCAKEYSNRHWGWNHTGAA